jgi:hypothetical protein
MKTPTERWGTYLEAAVGEAHALDGHVLYKFMEANIWRDLQKEGFAVPPRRALMSTLTAGLEPLPVVQIGTHACTVCSFEYVLNLLWYPIIQYIEALGKNAAPQWTQSLGLNQDAILSEMHGIVSSPDEALTMDLWVEFIQQTLWRLVKVQVPTRLIMQVVSPIVPLSLQPTPANAMHLLRSALCVKLVGPALAAQANRMILSEISEVPVRLFQEQDINLEIRKDLIASLEQQHCGPEEDDTTESRPLKKQRKDTMSLDENMTAKTKQALWMLENRVACSKVSETASSAAALISSLSSSSSSSFQQDDELFRRVALNKHLLLLDGAVDRYTSEKLMEIREQGRFAGVAYATDESPPSQPRFRGLRFQITVLYWGSFAPEEVWETSENPPITKNSALGDIMHCPGKKGVDVSRVLEKQLARVGLNCFDVTSGTGDGGGENEGHQGVHAYFENLSPGYVRRRCIPHISWRTCDLAIRSSDLDYKALAAYLCDGVTWSRLREIATKGPADGGLGLFKDCSQQCKNLFGRSPSAIIVSRPDTDLNFLKLLEGKEHLLHRVAVKDLEQRSLSAETQAAILNLGDIKSRIGRRVLQEILEKCMFLLYYNQKHATVAADTSWDELMQKAVAEILDLAITPQTLKRFGFSVEALEDMEARPKTWVELAVLQVVGEQDLVADRLQQALDFHRSVSDQSAAHLNLLCDNNFRTPWLAAKLLSKDKALAQSAAASLVRHLVTTRPANRTSFENHLFSQEHLWQNLVDFSKAEPPVLLWKGHGKYRSLFKFLAPRFLLAPDHVLDAERIHARWQWACTTKRAQKIQTLNATLRLMHYMEHNQFFPSNEDLLPHLHAEREQHKVDLEAVGADGEVALGWRYS